MDGLIGFTGFVGKNLDDGRYGCRYHSKNIGAIRGRSFDTLVCAGVPGHKTLANRYPGRDWEAVSTLASCLEQVECARLILISTVDVYPEGVEADERFPVRAEGLSPYGAHRVWMEEFVKRRFPVSCILRLPGIFGKGLKKNFIFDLMFGIPKMMDGEELDALSKKAGPEEAELVRCCYEPSEKGGFSLKAPRDGGPDYDSLRRILEKYGYDSLRFTDSRSEYSYYHLARLKSDMRRAVECGLGLVNLVTEPMTAGELAREAFGRRFDNRLEGREPVRFRIRSEHAGSFLGEDGYICGREQVIRELRAFDRGEICIF